MKYLMIICILVFSSVFVACAQAKGITQKLQNGESYNVEFYGGLILGPDKLLNNAMMQGKGQYILAERALLVSSEKITDISNGDLSIQVNGKTIKFTLSKTTKICDGTELLKLGDIKKDDMVTITSGLDQQEVLSVRKGPMLFGGIMSPPLILKKYKCIEENKPWWRFW